MKVLTLAAVFSAMVVAAPVFAADAQSGSMGDSSGVTQTAAVTGDNSMQAMHVAEPQGKTRAEVYQELIQAEKSGEYQRLNSTLYAN